MARSAPAVHLARLLVALAVAMGCGGKVIHLGDGRTGADGGSCVHAGVRADELVWIGDSWILAPGSQVTRVRDLARAAGAIGPNDEYVVVAAPATTMPMIAEQYNTRQMGATKVKALIMDGGAWESILANGAQAAVMGAGSDFAAHLAKVASDGTVEHVVYFLTPELPGIPGVAALRPLMQQACAQSVVACHFIDLEPLWTGHPEYTANNGLGILPSELGAAVLGDEIWRVMQQNCIAQ